ncbi:splicing factor [Tanacetum coccineum]
MSKGKKDKNHVFVVNLKHDGIFSQYPFSYIHGNEKQLTDFDFEGMFDDNLRELVKKMVHSPVHSLYYCKVGKTLKQGLCPLENDADVQEFLKAGYESKWVVDLYVEHHGYEPMDYKNLNASDYESPVLVMMNRQAILDTNPGSTCILDEEETEYGNTYFKRFYICFKGVKDGWKAGCRRVIGLDGCFLKHTCRGELVTAIGRDANNQMYPIAWAVVKVENVENWCWFVSLLAEDLELGHGTGITLISDSHKGLLDAVSDWLPNAEHRKYTRHVFTNFKKKFNEAIIPEAYTYLVERNPNSWFRAFFDLNSKCASFENGIAESFNREIIVQRTKPIITMLEDIRLYIMQRLVEMKIKAMNLEDRITPSIKKRLEILKEQQRFWTVIPSGFQELKVRHAYLFLNKEHNEGVDHWYSQEKWFEAYQFSIKPIYGSNMWKKQPNKPLLPPIVVRMPGRPRKNKVKSKTENNLQASGVLGEASGVVGEASGGIGQSNATRFQENTKRGESSGGRGRARGRGARGQGRGGRGRERSVTTMLVDEEEMNEEEIRKNMEHEYMKQILIEEEEERIAAEKAIQEELDKRLKVDT